MFLQAWIDGTYRSTIVGETEDSLWFYAVDIGNRRSRDSADRGGKGWILAAASRDADAEVSSQNRQAGKATGAIFATNHPTSTAPTGGLVPAVEALVRPGGRVCPHYLKTIDSANRRIGAVGSQKKVTCGRSANACIAKTFEQWNEVLVRV